MSTKQENFLVDMLIPRQSALDKAKIDLMAKPDSAFFTTVCLSLKHIWDDTIPAACTDGLCIRFNTTFFMGLSPEERIFLLIHESMHVAYLHVVRCGSRDHRKYNIAADHVINLMLIERKFQMPKGGLADPQYKDLSTEEVYDLLPDNPTSDGIGEDIILGEGSSQEIQQQIEDIVIRAAIQAKMQNDSIGSIPGEISIFLNKLLDPKLPWHRILGKYLYSMEKSDYSMRKPNRRFFPKYYLPSLYTESLVDIAIAVDTSGSVTDHDFLVFISEVNTILRTMRPKKIILIQFDTVIGTISTVRDVHELSKLSFSGRGGTNIVPVIDWANKNKPKLLLVFSDGEFRHSQEAYKAPLVWVIHNNQTFTAPYGKVVHYKI